MADAPGKDTPPNDPKPSDIKGAGKSGAVKPPVLEGTARPASAAKPAEKSAAAKAEKAEAAKPEKPEPAKPETAKPEPTKIAGTPPLRDKPEARGAAPWLAGVAGGVIGVGAAYGLAFFGLWPSVPVAQPPADPRIAAVAGAVPELQTVTGTIQDELATLNGRVSSLETDMAAAPAAAGDGGPELASDLAALSARVEELASQPAPATNTGSTETMAALESQLAELRTASADTAAQLAEANERIAAITTTTSEAVAASDGTAQLPLILSGLESAFGAGRGFQTELAALRTALPSVQVPEAVSAHAASGLPRPDDVRSRLTAAIPDMLAGRPAGEGQWQDATLDWFRGVVAMRPTGDIEGDGPDAVVARLEAAVARGDFTAAGTELDTLPQSMRAPLGTIETEIDALAEAEAFLAAVRTTALGGGSGT